MVDPEISDGFKFRRDGVDFSQWPILSCSQANQLALEFGDLRLDANREIFLQGNGQLRSFRDMLFLTGDSSLEKLKILANGNIGIGKPDPGAKLEVNGNLKLQQGVAINEFSSDGNLTENSDLSVPTEKAVKTYVNTQIAVVNQALSTKAALAGASSQDFQTKNLTVSGNLTTTGKVGIGTSTTPANLEVNGTVKATAFQGNGATLDGIVKKTGDTMTGALTINNALTVSGNVGIGTSTAPPNAKLEVVGTVKATSFQGDGSNLDGLVRKTGDTISGALTINNALTVSGNVGIGTSTTPANLEVNGTVKATAFQGNGATLDGIVKKTGDTMTGALTINNALTVSGNVGIGTSTTPANLEVNGTVKSTAFQGNGATLDGIVKKTGDTMTGALTINNALTVNGNVGIGTTQPQGFQIVLPESSKPLAPNPGVTITGGKVGNANIELRNNGTGTPFIDFAIRTDTDYDARIRLTEVGKLAIEGANFGIGTTSPSRKLHVVGDIYVEGNVIATGKYWSNAYHNHWQTIRIATDANWIWEAQEPPSDLQLKKDIVPINNALATVEQLQPVSFHWLDSNYFLKEVDKNLLHEAVQTEQDIEAVNQVKEKLKAKLERQQLGFIAQDVQRVFPDWVETGEDGYKKLNMTQLNAMLVQCIKELKAAHDESEAKNLELTRRLEILEKKVN